MVMTNQKATLQLQNSLYIAVMIFTESALWADSVIESPIRLFVYLSVCLSVCASIKHPLPALQQHFHRTSTALPQNFNSFSTAQFFIVASIRIVREIQSNRRCQC